MNYDVVKERLHGYIEHADEEKVLAIYTLISSDLETGVKYDEATLNSLEETMGNMLSGKEKGFTLEQTMSNIRQYRHKNGI